MRGRIAREPIQALLPVLPRAPGPSLVGGVGGPHTQHCGVSGVYLCAGQDFKCSPGTELISPSLRYLKAVFHPDPPPRGLPVGSEGVLEADTSEGKTQMSGGCTYLFIYFSRCMCLGGVLGPFGGEK